MTKSKNMPERIKVKVIPNSPKSEIVGWEGDILKIKIAAPAQKGEANRELLKLLKKKFKKSARIVQGEKARIKIIEL